MTTAAERDELRQVEHRRAVRAEQRVLELAALFGIPDGGQYINDAIERAVVLGAQESYTAAQDTVRRARGEAV